MPLHMTFDNKQNANTALFIINQNCEGLSPVGWFSEPMKSPGREFYFFPKPRDEDMEGLGHLSETYSIQEFNQEWKKEI